MVDVFLMGTAGSTTDPGRSRWREPFKEACAKVGIECFDPVVPEWNEAARQREADALRAAKVIVMAITSDTVALGSLAESGWAALSALHRKQAFGLFIDVQFRGEGVVSTQMVKLENYTGTGPDTVEEASRRARKLVVSHANHLTQQFPDLNFYVAKSMEDLKLWTVETAKRLSQDSGKPWEFWKKR
jgi:hypothetical protein